MGQPERCSAAGEPLGSEMGSEMGSVGLGQSRNPSPRALAPGAVAEPPLGWSNPALAVPGKATGGREQCFVISPGLSQPCIISLSCTLLLCLLGHTRKWLQDFFHLLLSFSPEGEILMQMSDTQRLLSSDLEVVVSGFPKGWRRWRMK